MPRRIIRPRLGLDDEPSREGGQTDRTRRLYGYVGRPVWQVTSHGATSYIRLSAS